MSQHRTAALKVLFLDYTLRNSSTGQYYVFNVSGSEGDSDICRMDSIHRSRVPWLFEALDKRQATIAPVVIDVNRGYRIDLSAIDDFAPNGQGRKPEEPARGASGPSKNKTRLQFSVETWKLEKIEALVKAEGYSHYSDWLRDLVDRVLGAKEGIK
jgi:hypothetical protein